MSSRSALTTTCSETSPGTSTTATVPRTPACTAMSRTISVLKPSRLACSVYVPAVSNGITSRPGRRRRAFAHQRGLLVGEGDGDVGEPCAALVAHLDEQGGRHGLGRRRRRRQGQQRRQQAEARTPRREARTSGMPAGSAGRDAEGMLVGHGHDHRDAARTRSVARVTLAIPRKTSCREHARGRRAGPRSPASSTCSATPRASATPSPSRGTGCP